MAKRGFFSSGNPFLSEKAIDKKSEQILDGDFISSGYQKMTVQGATNKTLILGALMLLTAGIGFMMPNPIFIFGGAILGLIAVLVASFKPQWSTWLAPAYALVEGLFVGGITAFYGAAFDGIVANAIILTLALFFTMLFLYKARIIKVTQKFRAGVFMATAAVALLYIASWVLGMFGIPIPFLHDTGLLGIGISLVIIGIACMNLLLDFDNFEQGEARGLPAYMEWFFAMGLLITLVWLYLEILRLLAKLQSD
ncbi:MAG: Bax inhibitor-1/YccA family protein [Flavobacteriales bacterium]|nr:Bax inhibitor-1/YccA family protein [Flavobacteriales bacterium]